MCNVIFDQPAGLGDIFFCQKIAKKHIEYGDNVYWPVIPQYAFISEYIKHEYLYFRKPGDNIRIEAVIDLKNASHQFPGSFMLAKYALAKRDWKDWIDYFTFDRKLEKELQLFSDVCPVGDYIVVGDTFASPPDIVYRPMNIRSSLPIVRISMLPGYTPFDWCTVLEKAKEIHIVDSCFTYFVEKLHTTDSLYLYTRNTDRILTSELWKKNWRHIA